MMTLTTLLVKTPSSSKEGGSRETGRNVEVRTKQFTMYSAKELNLLQQLNLRTSFGNTDISKDGVYAEEL